MIPISSLVERQLPGFVTDTGTSLLPKFLEYYYQFMESEQEYNNFTRDILRFFDSDRTSENVLDWNFEEIGLLPKNMATDKRKLAKSIYDFYKAKGTEESIKLLFRAFYEIEVTITYPSKNILKTSDGRWKQEHEVLVRLSYGSIDELTDVPIQLTMSSNIILFKTASKAVATGVNNEYWLTFEATARISPAIGNAIVGRDSNGDVLFVGHVRPTPSSISIVDAGKSFRVGQIFAIKGDYKDTIFRIVAVGANDEISKTEIIQFGYGHTDSTEFSISPYKSIPETTSVMYSSSPLGVSGIAHNLIITDTLLGVSDNIEGPTFSVNSLIVEQTSSLPSASAGLTISLYLDSIATLRLDTAAVSKYRGKYLTNDGMLSMPDMVLQDNYYYQSFSYVINSSVNLTEYQNSVLRLAHPAGMRNFANMLKTDDVIVSDLFEVSRLRKHILRLNDTLQVEDAVYKHVHMSIKEPYEIGYYAVPNYWADNYVVPTYSGPDPLRATDVEIH